MFLALFIQLLFWCKCQSRFVGIVLGQHWVTGLKGMLKRINGTNLVQIWQLIFAMINRNFEIKYFIRISQSSLMLAEDYICFELNIHRFHQNYSNKCRKCFLFWLEETRKGEFKTTIFSILTMRQKMPY